MVGIVRHAVPDNSRSIIDSDQNTPSRIIEARAVQNAGTVRFLPDKP